MGDQQCYHFSMPNYYYTGGAMGDMPITWPEISFVVLWTLFWGALALWHSARRGQYVWFIIFFLVHTLGILEIIYLFLVIKLKTSELFSMKDGNKVS